MPGINRVHYHYARGAYNSSYKTEPVYTPILGTDLPQFMHFIELWLSSNKATGAFYVRIRLSSQQPWVDIFFTSSAPPYTRMVQVARLELTAS